LIGDSGKAYHEFIFILYPITIKKRRTTMKKWIGVIIPVVLLFTSAAVFAARSPMTPVEAKKIDNKDAKKEFKQGVKAFKKAKYDEAATHFAAAAQAEPTLPEAHINLALALAEQGKADEAKKHFDEATTLITGSASSTAQKGGGATSPSGGTPPGDRGASSGQQGATSPSNPNSSMPAR
jgi:hypothetical protein